MIANRCCLNVDIGTTSIKSACYTFDGRLLGQSCKAMGYETNGYFAEADPALLFKTIIAVISEVIPQEGWKIDVLGFASQMSGLILLDKDRQPLTKIIYGIDYRGIEYCDELEKLLDRKTIYDTTGCPKSGVYLPGKLLWLKANQPEVIKQARYLMGIKEYILMLLTGEITTDHSSASTTQLYNRNTHTWWQEMLDVLEVKHCVLPKVAKPFATAGYLTKNAAEAVGLAEDLRVIVGSGDGPASTMAAGAVCRGAWCISFGTTTVTRYLTKTVRLDEERGYFCQHLYDNLFLQGIRMNETGREIAKYLEESQGCQQNADEVFYLKGSKDGFYSPAETGPSSAQKLQAVLDYVLFEVYKATSPVVEPEKLRRIHCIGGGSVNCQWMQSFADLFNMPVLLTASQDSTLGIALLAAVNQGIYKDVVQAAAKLVRKSKILRPNPENRVKLFTKYRTYLHLEDKFGK